MVAAPPGTSFFGTRLMVGFEEFSTEPPLLLLVLKGFWTWGLSLSLNWGAHIGCTYIHTCCLWWYLASFIQSGSSPPNQPVLLVFCTIWGRSTYDLGGLPLGVDISVAGCHRLTSCAFSSHTGCWVGSGDSSLAWVSCPAYFYSLEGLLPCCRGSGNCLVGCFKSFASHH